MSVLFTEKTRTARTTTLVLLFQGQRPSAQVESADPRARAVTHELLKEKLFRARPGNVLPVVVAGKEEPRTYLLLGLGEKEKLSHEVLRRAVGAASRSVRAEKTREVILSLSSASARQALDKLGWREGVRAIAEGWLLGEYSYDSMKTVGRDRRVSGRLVLVSGGVASAKRSEARAGLRIARALSRGVNLARELANVPGNELYPQTLAARARRLARASSITCRVLGDAAIRREKMGALLGVSSGSARPPRFVVLEYRPRGKALRTVVLVGKAVTFDSGGISIKPAKGMEDMKFDMAGGAAVIGALQVVSLLKPKLRVVGLVPASENVIGSSATRPGDVLRSASGKTIEVVNTDAEGRLLLADALHYARRFEPDYVIDLATLTGACVVALGSSISGFFSSDQGLAERLRHAGERSGEAVWQLPLTKEFKDAVKSAVADLKNSAGRPGGACTAAAFLAHFIEGVPWAHVDIAGTAWSHRARGYHPGGATGVGVRLVYELLADFEAR